MYALLMFIVCSAATLITVIIKTGAAEQEQMVVDADGELTTTITYDKPHYH